ncbi:DoxX family protein [Nocardia sp. NPDC050712]|uniref:DoxX family protein n=1 Tax=Nocardia sp. NPDC050712 TaxID=3155518 RepID=UPI0033FC8BF8
MFIAYAVVGILLSLMLVASARAKLVRDPKIVEGMGTLGVSARALPLLAAAEIAGAAGLLIGLWLAPLGVAAAIGVVAYFVGAVAAHLRVADYKNTLPAAVGLIVAIAVLGLRVASM